MAMWHAWFGWDREDLDMYGVHYDVAPATYSDWQVVGCVVSIATAAVLAQLWVRRAKFAEDWIFRALAVVLLAGSAAIGFVVPWTQDAASDPTADGLYMIGAFFFLVGGGAGLGVLLAVTDAVAGPRRATAS